MNAPKDVITNCIKSFVDRFKEESIKKNQYLPYHNDSWFGIGILIQWLADKYKNDIGVFCPFFLNYFVLKPYQSIFLEPNVPHAYISGECIEIMACSDNVVRAGLTNKHRDIDILISMLKYSMISPKINDGISISPYTNIYSPPSQFTEFMILKIEIPSNITKVTTPDIPILTSDSILLCIDGCGIIKIFDESYESYTDSTKRSSNTNLCAYNPYTCRFFSGISLYVLFYIHIFNTLLFTHVHAFYIHIQICSKKKNNRDITLYYTF